MLFAMAGCVSSFQRAWKVADSDRRLIPGRFLKHQPFGWVLSIRRLPLVSAFSFLIVGREDSNLRSSKASETTASRPVCETFNHSPYSLWLHHLPAFAPCTAHFTAGGDKNKRMIEKRCLHPSHPPFGNHPLNGMQWVAPSGHSRLAVVACHLDAFPRQLPPEILQPVR